MRRRLELDLLAPVGLDRRGGGGLVRHRDVDRVLLAPPLDDLAVLEDRGVVGDRVRGRVEVIGTVALAGAHRPGGSAVRVVEVVGHPHQPVAEVGEPGGDQVDGRRGDDEYAEEGEQRQQGHDDVRRPQQVEQQAGDDVPDRAAGLPQVGRVAGHRGRAAVGDVHDAERPEAERGPADQLPPDRAVVDGVAQVAPADVHEQQRDQPADLAHRAGDDGARDLHGLAGQLPPHGRGGDHGQAEHEQAEAVAAVFGLEVAGRAADAAGGGSDEVGDADPDGGECASEGAEGAEDRPGTRAYGARRLPPGVRRASARRTGGLLLASGTTRSGARAAPGAALGRTASGRALAPRPRWGRRTGRHGLQTTAFVTGAPPFPDACRSLSGARGDGVVGVTGRTRAPASAPAPSLRRARSAANPSPSPAHLWRFGRTRRAGGRHQGPRGGQESVRRPRGRRTASPRR